MDDNTQERTRRLEEWARDWYERAINQFDLTVIDEKCSETMACTNSTLWAVEGVQGNYDSYTRLHVAMPDAYCRLDEIFTKPDPIGGDLITAWFTITGTHTGPMVLPGGGRVVEPTGRSIVSSNVSMIQLRDWKMVAVRASSDMLVQLGVMPYADRQVS